MTRAQQARNAAWLYSEGNTLSRMNVARKVGADLGVLMVTDADKALLAPSYGKLPITTLGDYQSDNEKAGVLIDQGREPYLVSREALALDMNPFIAVWDVGSDLVTTRRVPLKQAVLASTQRGDALLSLDALIVWK